ncbi:hypothetical protein PENSOL_c001G10245 [Penicillium solitum]|uniref:Uncharacterized protein n=1 Tax=Penicillium solitum TaxID=60172 RepID=A0A1V6RQ44_9EURO|nr:uncharacterized protein PENSOL_c001G10245 [Penicillium solitum]OQE03897.1 hypothetical protein PENSOL_c001G10245 [Penicillium solitum]
MHIDRISCDVQVDEEQMCGKTFTLMGNFEKHTDIFHPACFVPFHLLGFNVEASRAAENSMKRWILTGGWRDASYLHEPGRCHSASPIGRMCDDLEEIAANNSTFAKKWGTRFHRGHTGARTIEPPPNPEDHKDNDAPSAEVNNTTEVNNTAAVTTAVTKRIEVIDLTD